MIRKFFFLFFMTGVLCLMHAQTYVWKDGNVLVEEPDSITFVQPLSDPVIIDSSTSNNIVHIKYKYLTTDVFNRLMWASSSLVLPINLYQSKHIGRMALYNHYTIMRSDECPTAGNLTIESVLASSGLAVVSSDYEGFGITDNHLQAYCFAEANAKVSIDALLAAKQLLSNQGFTISDSTINVGYSQGAQTAVAVLKLSQTTYRDKVHFDRTFAGAGPYDLRLTYRTFVEEGTLGLPAVIPLTLITLNELCKLGINYNDLFTTSVAGHYKSWVISKEYTSSEVDDFLGSDQMASIVQPAFLDTTDATTRQFLDAADKLNVMKAWKPDKETHLALFHSQNDDVVSPANSQKLYDFLIQAGVQNASYDKTSLTQNHSQSGMTFAMMLINLINQWKNATEGN